MAITDIAASSPATSQAGPECAVCEFLAELPEDQAAALESLMSNTAWRYSAIAAKVKDDPDYPRDILSSTYSRHARGGCYKMRQAGRQLR